MCVAIPGKIIEFIDDESLKKAKVDFGGIVKEACIAWIPTVNIGDYVIVHAGFAINVVDEKEAINTLDLFKNIAEKMEE